MGCPVSVEENPHELHSSAEALVSIARIDPRFQCLAPREKTNTCLAMFLIYVNSYLATLVLRTNPCGTTPSQFQPNLPPPYGGSVLFVNDSRNRPTKLG